jgi:hypothetical protein
MISFFLPKTLLSEMSHLHEKGPVAFWQQALFGNAKPLPIIGINISYFRKKFHEVAVSQRNQSY